MKIFGMTFGKEEQPKEETALTVNKDSLPGEATISEARTFFGSFLNSLSHDFHVDTPAQILDAYRTIPQLNTLINNAAGAFVRGAKILYDVDNQGVETPDATSDIYKVFQRPHLLQSKDEFWKTLYINWALFGRTHIFKTELAGFGLSSLLVLPSADVCTVLKENPDYLFAQQLSDIIAYYLLDEGKEGVNELTKITDVDSIWTFRDASLSTKNNGFLTNENPLKAYEYTLGTLKVIPEVRNELIANHGAVGILGPGNNADGAGESQPWQPSQQKDVQKAYTKYGVTKGKNKLIITNQHVKFTAISLPIAELLLNEFEEKASETLANGKNYPVVLLSGNKQYRNKDSGTKDLYENKIIPEDKIIMSAINSDLGLEAEGKVFRSDFSSVAALQADKEKESTRRKTDTETLSMINKDVSEGITDWETGVNRVMDLGRTQQDAEKLVSKPIIK